jgi:hypothetical protein
LAHAIATQPTASPKLWQEPNPRLSIESIYIITKFRFRFDKQTNPISEIGIKLTEKTMVDFKEWLNGLKSEKPELSDFITRLTPFFSESGFNSSDFEKRVNKGLKQKENEILQLLSKPNDSQAKENIN